MRILLLSGEIACSDAGLYALYLHRGLVAAGHEVLHVARGGALGAPPPAGLVPVEHHELSGAPWRDLFELNRILPRIAAFRPEVLHVTHHRLDPTAATLARRLEISRVTAVHELDPAGLSARREPEAVLVPGQGLRVMAVNQVGFDRSRVQVIPYGVPAAERAPHRPGRPTIGTLGPLHRDRGLKPLVRAMATVAADHGDLLFAIIGSGPYHRFLARHLRAHDLETRTVVCEPCAEPEQACQGWDAAVFPSTGEEFSFPALFTMSLGLPVVATTVGAAVDLVRDEETGFLVPPGDVAALAERMGALVADPLLAERLGQAGAERARRDFPLEKMVASVEALHEQALERTRKAPFSRSGRAAS